MEKSSSIHERILFPWEKDAAPHLRKGYDAYNHFEALNLPNTLGFMETVIPILIPYIDFFGKVTDITWFREILR